jgi:hypothetical protein
MHKNENTQNSHSFLVLAFFYGTELKQHKILRLLVPILIFSRKKFFGVIIAHFEILNAGAIAKETVPGTFLNILPKSK